MREPRPLRVDRGDRIRGSAPSRGPVRRTRRAAPARRSWRGAVLRLFVLLFLWGLIVGGSVLGYFALTLPDTSQLASAERRPSVTVLAEDDSLIGSFGDLFGKPLSLREMSPYLPQAVIAAEDRRFYSHFGIDPIGILRAAVTNFRAGEVRPGRQHDHAAARQDRVPEPGSEFLAQDPRGVAGAVARAPLYEEPDPRNLSEPRLSRRRGLWGRCGGRALFRQVGGKADPVRERHHRRADPGPEPAQPGARPHRRDRARRRGAERHGRGRVHHPRPGRCRRKARLCAGARAAVPGRAISPTGSPSRSANWPAPASGT